MGVGARAQLDQGWTSPGTDPPGGPGGNRQRVLILESDVIKPQESIHGGGEDPAPAEEEEEQIKPP